MLSRLAAALLAALLLAPPAAADLRALVGELRSEPLSLFDWGLYQLERELQGVRRHDLDFIRVFYDPQAERIFVDGVFHVTVEEIAAITPQRACYTRHHAIKLALGVIDTTRVHRAPAAEFRMGLKFSHRDPERYPELPDAEAVGAELMQATFIRVGISSSPERFPFDQDMRCEGLLLSQDVAYHGQGVERYLPE